MFLNIITSLLSSRKYAISGSFPVCEILKIFVPVIVHIIKRRRIKSKKESLGVFSRSIFDLFGKKLAARRVTVKIEYRFYSVGPTYRGYIRGYIDELKAGQM